MIKYPSNILPPVLIQFSGNNDPILATTQFEVSLRQRQLFNHTEQEISAQLLLSDFQFSFFKSWVAGVLKAGSLSFLIPLPGVDGIVDAEVKIIGGKLAWEAKSNKWQVSFQLKEEKPDLADAAIVEFLASLEDGDATDFLSMEGVLSLHLNQFYGSSPDNPTISNFIIRYQ